MVANEKRICDVDVGWPGTANDSRVWRRSGVKSVWEEQDTFKMAGDSAYPISTVLITPYRAIETVNQPRKRLFNGRLSGLRTVLTENVYARWKKRFPCLREMRTHLKFGQKIIVACSILHNMAR